MTEAEVKRIVAESVDQTLTRLGVDVTDPLEFQKDMAHLRAWRESVATVKKQGLITALWASDANKTRCCKRLLAFITNLQVKK